MLRMFAQGGQDSLNSFATLIRSTLCADSSRAARLMIRK